jgi:hypothetical protein
MKPAQNPGGFALSRPRSRSGGMGIAATRNFVDHLFLMGYPFDGCGMVGLVFR